MRRQQAPLRCTLEEEANIGKMELFIVFIVFVTGGKTGKYFENLTVTIHFTSLPLDTGDQ